MVPDLVVSSMCAPLFAPCDASYIAEFTRTSWIVSTGGVGSACPIAPYTDVLVTIWPLGLLALFPLSPMFTATRAEVT